MPETAGLAVKSAIIDREVIDFERDGRPTIDAFRAALSSDLQRLVFVAFDLLFLDGQDLRGLVQVERRERLAALIGREADGESGIGNMWAPERVTVQ
ncbi:hypothetical protein SAZ10_29050 [Mesorhizobium sp. BAC0120]|uniref:hypothetical protein n=1 Tax=Mesorhizobium sp. BAC0120 TaxID=3090670 RepID=UPI00298D5C8E|nr:hypothetical protein [Mesorhizobium sp. BAC0120]MDW6025819.1 hypothetical protein [Mesorhizobium sp. BAC0120]